MDEKPAFEVRMPDGHVYKVFASGHTEGFAEDRNYIIVNRIGADLRQAYNKGFVEGRNTFDDGRVSEPFVKGRDGM